MYGFLIIGTTIIVTLVAEKLALKKELNPDLYWKGILFAVLFGIIGARSYHVICELPFYLSYPERILQIQQGGLGIIGGFIGGLLGVIWILKKQSLKYLNLFAVFLPLIQSVGRWGNFFNHELYGLPYNGMFRLFIPKEFRPINMQENAYYHPLFLYESFLNLGLFFILYVHYKKNKNTLFLYMIGYGTIRFLLEFLRITTWKIDIINVTQVICLFAVVLGIYFYKKFDKITT